MLRAYTGRLFPAGSVAIASKFVAGPVRIARSPPTAVIETAGGIGVATSVEVAATLGVRTTDGMVGISTVDVAIKAGGSVGELESCCARGPEMPHAWLANASRNTIKRRYVRRWRGITAFCVAQ